MIHRRLFLLALALVYTSCASVAPQKEGVLERADIVDKTYRIDGKDVYTFTENQLAITPDRKRFPEQIYPEQIYHWELNGGTLKLSSPQKQGKAYYRLYRRKPRSLTMELHFTYPGAGTSAYLEEWKRAP